MGSKNEIITLNVGGYEYMTTRATLTKYPESMLAAMFSDNMPSTVDDKGRDFIDRDGKMFEHVLRFIRSNKLVLPDTFNEFNALYAEADFYQIQSLIDAIDQIKGSENLRFAWNSFLLVICRCDGGSNYGKVYYKLSNTDEYRECLEYECNKVADFSAFTSQIKKEDPTWFESKRLWFSVASGIFYLSYLGLDFIKTRPEFLNKKPNTIGICTWIHK